MNYHHQAKATAEFGIEFRSKLEASWAYAINGLGVPWEYVDGEWFDFSLELPWSIIHLEVKPIGATFFLEAVKRIPAGETLYVLQGEPRRSASPQTIALNAPIRCVYRHEPSSVIWSQVDMLVIRWLEAMWHSTRSWPARVFHPTPISELERSATRTDELLQQLAQEPQ